MNHTSVFHWTRRFIRQKVAKSGVTWILQLGLGNESPCPVEHRSVVHSAIELLTLTQSRNRTKWHHQKSEPVWNYHVDLNCRMNCTFVEYPSCCDSGLWSWNRGKTLTLAGLWYSDVDCKGTVTGSYLSNLDWVWLGGTGSVRSISAFHAVVAQARMGAELISRSFHWGRVYFSAGELFWVTMCA